MTDQHLLFVANFPSGTGYAWRTIEQVFRRTVELLSEDGVRAWACYPSLREGVPEALRSAGVEVFEFDHRKTAGVRGAIEFARLLHGRRIRILYLTDQRTLSLRYPLYRLAGVDRIVVHERTSGERAARGRLWQALKRGLQAVRPLTVDRAIAVSDFVAKRLVLVNAFPGSRVVRIYNGIDFGPYDQPRQTSLHSVLGISAATRFVFASGRAMWYKGISVLLQTAQSIEDTGPEDVHFAYAGDGPALCSLQDQADRLGLERFHFLGRRDDVPDLLRSATVAVVPSVWAEAFGLTVVEAMAAGRPVVATRTGGIPELLEDGVTGLLVPPGDSAALAAAIQHCLDDPIAAAKMGHDAAIVARQRFSLDRVAAEVAETIRELL